VPAGVGPGGQVAFGRGLDQGLGVADHGLQVGRHAVQRPQRHRGLVVALDLDREVAVTAGEPVELRGDRIGPLPFDLDRILGLGGARADRAQHRHLCPDLVQVGGVVGRELGQLRAQVARQLHPPPLRRDIVGGLDRSGQIRIGLHGCCVAGGQSRTGDCAPHTREDHPTYPTRLTQRGRTGS
jgi:hypothetical protein